MVYIGVRGVLPGEGLAGGTAGEEDRARSGGVNASLNLLDPDRADVRELEVSIGEVPVYVCSASGSQSKAKTTSIPAAWNPQLAPPQPEKKSKTLILIGFWPLPCVAPGPIRAVGRPARPRAANQTARVESYHSERVHDRGTLAGLLARRPKTCIDHAHQLDHGAVGPRVRLHRMSPLGTPSWAGALSQPRTGAVTSSASHACRSRMGKQ